MYKEKFEEEESSIVIITNLSKQFDELLGKYNELSLNVIVFANHVHANLTRAMYLYNQNAKNLLGE